MNTAYSRPTSIHSFNYLKPTSIHSFNYLKTYAFQAVWFKQALNFAPPHRPSPGSGESCSLAPGLTCTPRRKEQGGGRGTFEGRLLAESSKSLRHMIAPRLVVMSGCAAAEEERGRERKAKSSGGFNEVVVMADNVETGRQGKM